MIGGKARKENRGQPSTDVLYKQTGTHIILTQQLSEENIFEHANIARWSHQ